MVATTNSWRFRHPRTSSVVWTWSGCLATFIGQGRLQVSGVSLPHLYTFLLHSYCASHLLFPHAPSLNPCHNFFVHLFAPSNTSCTLAHFPLCTLPTLQPCAPSYATLPDVCHLQPASYTLSNLHCVLPYTHTPWPVLLAQLLILCTLPDLGHPSHTSSLYLSCLLHSLTPHTLHNPCPFAYLLISSLTCIAPLVHPPYLPWPVPHLSCIPWLLWHKCLLCTLHTHTLICNPHASPCTIKHWPHLLACWPGTCNCQPASPQRLVIGNQQEVA